MCAYLAHINYFDNTKTRHAILPSVTEQKMEGFFIQNMLLSGFNFNKKDLNCYPVGTGNQLSA